jgi:hypothetical protein
VICNCAVVDTATTQVTNVIVADPDVDQPYPGTILVAIPDGVNVSTSCTWTQATGFLCPVGP